MKQEAGGEILPTNCVHLQPNLRESGLTMLQSNPCTAGSAEKLGAAARQLGVPGPEVSLCTDDLLQSV